MSVSRTSIDNISMIGANEVTIRLPRSEAKNLINAFRRGDGDAYRRFVAGLKDHLEATESAKSSNFAAGEGPIAATTSFGREDGQPIDPDEPTIIKLPRSEALALVRGGVEVHMCFAVRLEKLLP